MILLLSGIATVLALSVILAVTIGSVWIPPQTVWEIALARLFGWSREGWTEAQEHIVVFIRFPRVLLSAVVGSGLAVVGVILQAAVRNPMADPYILGVSSGASVGAVLVLLFGYLKNFGVYGLSAGAFLGGMAVFAVIFILSSRQRRITPVRIILTGIALSYFCSALTSFLILKSKDHAASQTVLFWLMGSMAGARWEHLGLPVVILFAGAAYLIVYARSINLLVLGDETAIILGVHPNRLRKQLLTHAALLTGVMVSLSGGIGFVALMVPHAIRMLVGSDHRRVLPVSLLVGGIFLIWVDVLARTALQPEEIPITIITAFSGTPFILWLMYRKERWTHGA